MVHGAMANTGDDEVGGGLRTIISERHGPYTNIPMILQRSTLAVSHSPTLGYDLVQVEAQTESNPC